MDTTSQGTENSKPLRTALERDTEYSQCATLVGDKIFRVQLLNSELNSLYQKMATLVQEQVQLKESAPTEQVAS